MVQNEIHWRRSALSRIPRPKRIEICGECGRPLGTNYPTCESCFHIVEDRWRADWAALLEQERIESGSPDEALLAQIVIDESDRHPFTVLDMAMTLQRCQTCGTELGSRYQECGECAIAFGSALAAEYGITGNAHALHVGRWILRHPRQHSANILVAWRFTVPRLLTGWLPTTEAAQHWMNKIKAGEIAQVETGLLELDQYINAISASTID